MSATRGSATTDHNNAEYQDPPTETHHAKERNGITEDDKDRHIKQLQAEISELVAENEQLKDSNFSVQRKQRTEIEKLKSEKEELAYLLEQATQDFGVDYTFNQEELSSNELEEENNNLREKNNKLQVSLREREMTLATTKVECARLKQIQEDIEVFGYSNYSDPPSPGAIDFRSVEYQPQAFAVTEEDRSSSVEERKRKKSKTSTFMKKFFGTKR